MDLDFSGTIDDGDSGDGDSGGGDSGDYINDDSGAEWR